MGKGGNLQPACRDYTLNMHKRLQGIQFKKRAPKAIKLVRKFAQKEMFTKVSFSPHSILRVSCWGYFWSYHQWSVDVERESPKIWIYSIVDNANHLAFCHVTRRMFALTPNWTDTSGWRALETFLARSESEWLERETRTKMPRRNSTASFSTSILKNLTRERKRSTEQTVAYRLHSNA